MFIYSVFISFNLIIIMGGFEMAKIIGLGETGYKATYEPKVLCTGSQIRNGIDHYFKDEEGKLCVAEKGVSLKEWQDKDVVISGVSHGDHYLVTSVIAGEQVLYKRKSSVEKGLKGKKVSKLDKKLDKEWEKRLAMAKSMGV